MNRFAFPLGLLALCSVLAGCSGSSADGDDASEGALEQDGAQSRHDLKSFAFVYGFVAVNDEATDLYDKIKAAGGKMKGKTVYAGLTWKDMGEQTDDDGVFGINCVKDEGSGAYSINSCMFTGIVKADATKNLPANAAPVMVTVGGRVAKAMMDALPRTSPEATGVGRVSCKSTSASAASCTLPVVVAGDAVQTLDQVFASASKPEDRASIEKLVDAFIDK